MRNLKRVLALGMALVLTLGLMVTASAATAGTSYTDDAAIGMTNDEAVQVLTALGVFQGDGKAFNPADKVTRMEVAALAYRIMTADVDDANIGLYKTWKKFDDVKSTDWAAGYINYVANAGILDGDGQGNFFPTANVNGYQLLKIILCALGYGQNGEYIGADWDKRTSSKATELGLLAGVSEDLGQPITRATVAQILFNGMTKALVVDYFLGYYWPMNIYTGAVVTDQGSVQGGSAEGADSGDYIATLGYKQFGLFANNAGTGVTTLVKMGARNKAEADEKYGEPLGKWYIDADKSGDIDNDEAEAYIPVRFNPIATFTTAVTEKALYAAAKLSKTNAKIENVAIDGVDSQNVEVSSTAATAFEGTGKGVVTEVFKADGKEFVVIKNTYVNKVTQNLTVKANGDIDKDLALNGTDVGATKADIAALKDIKNDTVVIYNKYEDDDTRALTIDLTTIHAAPEYKVTVTNTYDTDEVVKSYFLAGKKYEYNALYATDSDITENPILNRDDKIANGDDTDFNKKQVIYTDDNGYVVLAKDQKAAGYAYGYVVLTKAAYNNYELDNVHYVKFTGYDANGKAVTLNGGIDTFVYADAGVANAVATGVANETAAFEKGIYFFEYDAELGLHLLTNADQYDHDKYVQPTVELTAGDTDENGTYVIYNGKADALDEEAVLDNETVFVIVKYNDKGGITGYTVKTGFKTIDDLYDHDQKTAEGDGWNTMLKNVDWKVSYVDIDGKTAKDLDDNDVATIDLVYIEGATAEDDNDGYETKDDGFILLDIVPEDKVTEYDLHTVVVNGKVQTMKFWPDFVATYEDADGNKMEAGKYYEVDQYRKGYVYSLTDEVVEPVALKYVAPGILDASDNVWADENADSCEYLTLNDKCVVYEVDVLAGTCTAAKDITKVDTKGDETAIIAARDDYGFATIIYIVDLGV